ncbi:MAG: LytTR family DNA-binding domain-containing protein [Polyangiaceae bacterium]
MTPLRILLADDELQARKRLVRLVQAMPDVEIVAVCASGDEVLERVPAAAPDLLLLDISMPGRTGIELRAALPDDLLVVFVTAHAEHAVQAFDLGATDYVLKPVTAARLERAVERARERARRGDPVRARSAEPAPRIPIETRQGIVLVDPDTIVHASFDGALVEVVTSMGAWLTTSSLREIEARLPPKFERVDRRNLLNLDEIARLEPASDGSATAVTRGGQRIHVSRQSARDLRRRLGL